MLIHNHTRVHTYSEKKPHTQRQMPSRATSICEGEQTQTHTHTQANIHTHSAACLKLANKSICHLQRCQVFVVRTLSIFPLTNCEVSTPCFLL